MNRGKDIEKEIDGYVKGNYSKKNAVELLKRDGFSESEINEHLYKLDLAEKANSMNYSFVPGFLFILISSFFLLTTAFSSEENSHSTLSLLGFIISIPLIYFYYKGDKFSILITGFAILCFILLRTKGLFHSHLNIFSELLLLFFSVLILISVKNYYKSFKF